MQFEPVFHHLQCDHNPETLNPKPQILNWSLAVLASMAWGYLRVFVRGRGEGTYVQAWQRVHKHQARDAQTPKLIITWIVQA